MRHTLWGALFLLGCSGTPTEPDGVYMLATAYGTVTVTTPQAAIEMADMQVLRRSLERGQERALRQRQVPSLDGLRVAVWSSASWPCGTQAHGCYTSQDDTAHAFVGVQNVVEHEVQHRQAWKLGHRGDCYTLQDHWPVGYDLACRRHG